MLLANNRWRFWPFFVFIINDVCAQTPRKINIYEQKQGDITQLFDEKSDNLFRNAIQRNSDMKWIKNPNGFVYIQYVYKGVTYPLVDINVIRKAVQRIQYATCIKFIELAAAPLQGDYITFLNKPNEGCYSTVGRVYGENIISLESNANATCVHYDIVIHEVLHSLGLWHEHMRHDRDDYVTINYDNIPQKFWRQFSKISQQRSNTYGLKYDYYSIMHYTKSAFARDGNYNLITVRPKDPSMLEIIGNSKDVTNADLIKVCRIYDCPGCVGTVLKPITTTSGTTTTTTPRPNCKNKAGQICIRFMQKYPGSCTRWSFMKQYCKETCQDCHVAD